MRLLSSREEQILRAIVELHTQSGEAVSSGAVSRRLGRDLSPASVRAVMAVLEEEGLLQAKHSSSGRAPTDEGLRRHATQVLAAAEAAPMPSLEQGPPDRLMRGAARWLADASHATAVLAAPHLDSAVLTQIRFVPLGDRTLLAVLVTREGLRSECVIESRSPLTESELDRAHDLLAERVEGRTLRQIRDDLEEELRAASRSLGPDRATLWLALQALESRRPELLVEGEVNLLEHPDLDPQKLRVALVALREKERLAELLDRTLSHRGPIVWIGETPDHPDLRGLALIAMPYEAGGSQGAIAVLGPTRLDYGRIVSLVDSVARALTSTLGARA